MLCVKIMLLKNKLCSFKVLNSKYKASIYVPLLWTLTVTHCKLDDITSSWQLDALPTPEGIQMWIQTGNNGKVKSWGTFPSL
jgi:hypothetical protein